MKFILEYIMFTKNIANIRVSNVHYIHLCLVAVKRMEDATISPGLYTNGSE